MFTVLQLKLMENVKYAMHVRKMIYDFVKMRAAVYFTCRGNYFYCYVSCLNIMLKISNTMGCTFLPINKSRQIWVVLRRLPKIHENPILENFRASFFGHWNGLGHTNTPRLVMF